ncbi:hypothetical protein FHR79_002174 [Micrococcus aloeverae]|uniref:RiboL-PSP-HEPN domain-containing protein n=1 Tax=Micrococcus aloeverae TaxID=1391911 RepID=A0ABR6E198_9MICC|nr:hypothetical protein [Micrococcus aloeverae]MBA9082038.1 hypothetical protein [Micrococcus aloeverae]
MAKWQIEQPFEDCLERLEWQRRNLQTRDVQWRKAKQAQRIAQDAQSRAERAFTFVFAAGALEDLFRRIDTDLPDDLRRLEVKRWHLRPTAMAMLMPEAWESISTDRVLRMTRRSEVVRAANNFYIDEEPLEFGQLRQLGISDGRTVNAHHFEALWEGLCLSAGSEPVWESPAHRQAVAKLAETRNLIAHFETDPRQEAFRSTYGDLETTIKRVIESVTRLNEHLVLWLDRFEKVL